MAATSGPLPAQPHNDSEFWLFGYASLIWKPPPHFDCVWGVAYRILADRVAEVKEYLDIREINGYTIHYAPFHVAPDADPALLPPAPRPGDASPGDTGAHKTIRTLVYIGTPENDQFVGPQDPQQLAEHIYRSEGPSGLNRDYLWGLEHALEHLSQESGDDHVSDLSRRVRVIAGREDKREAPRASAEYVAGDNTRPEAGELRGVEMGHRPNPHNVVVASVDESEETEKVA